MTKISATCEKCGEHVGTVPVGASDIRCFTCNEVFIRLDEAKANGYWVDVRNVAVADIVEDLIELDGEITTLNTKKVHAAVNAWYKEHV